MKHLFLIVFTFLSLYTLACCGGSQYQIFPLGTSNEKLVVAELKITRYCRSSHGGNIKGTHIKGYINLAYWSEDSVVSIEKSEEFTFKISDREGQLDAPFLDSLYVATILPVYQKMLKKAQKLSSFKEVKPINYGFVNDSVYNEYEIKNDSILMVNGKEEIFKSSNYSDTRGYLNCIRDVRQYQVGDKKVTILNVNERFGQFVELNKKDSYINDNKTRFKELKTALTYDKILWHGENRNYVFFE